MREKESRLVELIKSFNKNEWKGFVRFVRYKMPNSTGVETELLYALKRIYPNFDRHDLSRPGLLKIIGRNDLTDQKLRWAMTCLHTLAADYLKQLESDGSRGDFLLLNQYAKRRLYRHHTSLSKKMKQRTSNLPKDLGWYFSDHRLSYEIDQVEEQQTARRQMTGLQEVSDKLDTYFLLTKLKQACAMLTYQRVSNHEYNIGLLSEVLQHLENHPPNVPLLQMYHCCARMMHTEKREYYEALLALLSESAHDIHSEEIRDLHVLARNHCIRKVNLGDRTYERELFNLYKLGLLQEVLQANPAQFAPSFKNIVSVSIKLEEFDWAEMFIQDHAHFLGPRFEADYLRYNLALINFSRGRFEKCRSYIHGESYTDLFIKLNVRVLLVKTYYELGEIDQLEAQLESFKQFLHRNDQLSYHRKNCLNLIRFVKSIINIAPNDSAAKSELRSRIDKAVNISERKWLITKVQMA